MIAIKMTAYDSVARQRYEVTPDTLPWVKIEDCTPVFWSEDRYVTVPGCTAESVMDEWLEQYDLMNELREWRLDVLKSRQVCDRQGELNALAAIAVLEELLGIKR